MRINYDNKIPENNTLQPGEIPGVPFILTLGAAQYFRYQTHCSELRAPDGRHLEFVGKMIEQDRMENTVYRLRKQIYLVACLLGNISADTVDIPMPAMSGLADLFCQMQKIFDKNM